MNRNLRTACFLLLGTFATAALGGCALTVNEDGSITAETLVKYVGSSSTESVAYTSGQAVRISGVNGQIRVVKGSGSEVKVTFAPFTMNKSSGEDAARNEMKDLLALSVTNDGDVVVKTSRKSGASGYLGADITVALPPSFDGAFKLSQNNGSVDVDLGGTSPTSTTVDNDGAGSVKIRGARGKLAITASFDVTVDVAAWSHEPGAITIDGLGDLSFTLPANVDGALTAYSTEGTLKEPSPMPGSWVSAGEGASKSYTMGNGDGGQVDLKTKKDITIIAK